MTAQANDFFDDVDSNPLLQGLPPTCDLIEWGVRLKYDPRTEWKGRPTMDQAFDAVEQIRRVFAPTPASTQIAWRLHRMLRQGLIERDPRRASNRRRVYECTSMLGRTLDSLPWFPTNAVGMIIKGITRQGKSHVVSRVLDFFPQMIERSENEEGGWIDLKQLVHLTVPMPADASRKGFLLAAFSAIDAALGTDYESRYSTRSSSVETQLVHLLICLAVHRCGVLVIEEAQHENLSKAHFGKEFVTFFLRVLNYGIPLVMVGNPKAFDAIQWHSQNISRLSEAGSFNLDPVSDWRSSVWSRDLVRSIWGWNILEEPDEEVDGLEEVLWKYTAGFPGYLARLRKETLLQCLQANAPLVQLKHIQRAFESAPMRELHPIINAFVKKDPLLLGRLTDVPVEYFADKWDREAKAALAAEAAKGSLKAPCSGNEAQVPASDQVAQPKRHSTRASRGDDQGEVFDADDFRSAAVNLSIAAKVQQSFKS